MLFQGCTVARSWMKRITSHNRHNTQISNHLWPQPGNLQPSCAVDFCAGSRRGKLNLASVVEMEGDESGGAPAKKKKIGWLMKVRMTRRCVWLILRWRSVWVRMSLADLWQYPLLHGPLLRAEHPDAVVVYLFNQDGLSGTPPEVLGPGCHFWEPKTILLGHILFPVH